MPQAVQQVAGLALKAQHSFIDTIKEEDSATNVQARQSIGRTCGWEHVQRVFSLRLPWPVTLAARVALTLRFLLPSSMMLACMHEACLHLPPGPEV